MSEINRATGLLVLEVVNSNPNGDPDRESDPRQRANGQGEISPVSFKRKLRDLVGADKAFDGVTRVFLIDVMGIAGDHRREGRARCDTVDDDPVMSVPFPEGTRPADHGFLCRAVTADDVHAGGVG